MYKWYYFAALIYLITFPMSCSFGRYNPLDEGGTNYIPPKITIDEEASSLKNGDTIHFDTITVVLVGNHERSLFSLMVDSNHWEENWEPAGAFVFGRLADGKRTLYIHSMYRGGELVVSDSITFSVLTKGYKPAFSRINDTTISSDTGKIILLAENAAGKSPIEYAWFKKGVSTPQRLGDTLKLEPFLLIDTSSYFCIATNKYGVDSSRFYILKYHVASGGIMGTITDADDNKKLSGVQISLLPTNRNTVTDSSGQFIFKNLSAKTYSLSIMKSGFVDTTIGNIAVNDSETLALSSIVLSRVIICKVIYNGSDNTNGFVPVDTSLYKPGMTVTVSGNTGNLKKTGCTFNGWRRSMDGGGTVFQPFETFLIGKSNDTLFTVWEVNQYNLSFHGSGSVSGTPPSVLTRDYNTSVTIPDKGTLERPGYSFSGWNTNEQGTGKSFTPGDTLIMPDSNIVLFAKWDKLSTFKVTYNGNKNTGGTAPTDTNSYYQSQKVTIAAAGNLEKTGNTFYRWNTDSTGSGIDYNPGDQITMNGENIDLYARWTKNKYKVVYVGNGSDGGTVPQSVDYDYNSTVNVADKGTMSRTGHSFNGWNRSKNGGGSNIAPGSNFTMGAFNDTLFAQWKANRYTVRFNTLGGNTIDSIFVNYGDTVPLPSKPNKQSYVFSKWCKDSECSVPWNSSTNIITANDTLFAKWVIMDVDGNIYTEVKIGDQVWMVENLKVTKYRDGIPIPKMSETNDWLPGYCWYNNDSATFKNPYGALYNWYVVNPVNTRKVSPEGWHVPSDEEWTELENYLITNGYNYDGTTTDNKIAKSLASTTLWNIENNEGAIGDDLSQNNRSGFSAYPAGSGGPVEFGAIGNQCYWWSTTEISQENELVWHRYLDYFYFHLDHGSSLKTTGLSVRCLRDW